MPSLTLNLLLNPPFAERTVAKCKYKGAPMTWSPNDSTEGLRYEVDDHCQEHVSDDHINVGALWRWRVKRADTNCAPGVECYLGQGWHFDSDTYTGVTPARYQRLVTELKRVA